MTQSDTSSLTPLEHAVLRAICKEYPSDRAALEAQLATATVLRRENTGAGFFTYLSVERTSSNPIGGYRLRNGPNAKVEGLEHGMGFILWLKEGYINCLEGYAYAGSTTAIAFDKVSFELLPD
ncbi:MAG TPA: hypothetical protein VKB26_11040 [Candidatus Acidoferrales bacterium]|nr:hypothetical protein [Candidatus Acidoferrales bacterium]